MEHLTKSNTNESTVWERSVMSYWGPSPSAAIVVKTYLFSPHGGLLTYKSVCQLPFYCPSKY